MWHTEVYVTATQTYGENGGPVEEQDHVYVKLGEDNFRGLPAIQRSVPRDFCEKKLHRKPSTAILGFDGRAMTTRRLNPGDLVVLTFSLRPWSMEKMKMYGVTLTVH
jgi:hypothetical protein